MKWADFYDRFSEWSESTIENRISSLEDFGSMEEILDATNFIGDDTINAAFINKALSYGIRFAPKDILELDGVISEETTEMLVRQALKNGNVFSFEEINGLDGLIGEKCMSEIIMADIQKGISFTQKQITELDGLIAEAALTEAVKTSKSHFTEEDLESLDGCVDYEVLLEIDRKQGTHVFPGNDKFDDDEEEESFIPRDTKKPSSFFEKVAMAFSAGTGISDGIKDATAGKPRKYRVGDRVRVKYRGQEGTVIDINGDLYMVSLKDGAFVDSYTESQLERAW